MPMYQTYPTYDKSCDCLIKSVWQDLYLNGWQNTYASPNSTQAFRFVWFWIPSWSENALKEASLRSAGRKSNLCSFPFQANESVSATSQSLTRGLISAQIFCTSTIVFSLINCHSWGHTFHDSWVCMKRRNYKPVLSFRENIHFKRRMITQSHHFFSPRASTFL